MRRPTIMAIAACAIAFAAGETARAQVDDRGATASQGPATWARAALQMAPRFVFERGKLVRFDPLKFEVGHLMSPDMPQSPFAPPFDRQPIPTRTVLGHAFNGDTVSGEIGQQGTQLDAIGHFAYLPEGGGEAVYYGGLTQSEVVGPNGLLRLGIEHAEPMITTAVVLDAKKFVNGGAALPAGYAISRADIDKMLAAQDLAKRGILPGDVVFIHTGWGDKWYNDPATYYTEGPGLSHEAATYLAERGIALLGLDNPFTDAASASPFGPFPPPDTWADGNPNLPFGVHHHNLTQAGVLQIQNLYLTKVAEARIYVGAVFILPLRLEGAAGSPVRPVVIGHPAP